MIQYKVGNALEPEENKVIIVHCCNDLGVMGAGIAASIKKKWPHVFEDYCNGSKELGDATLVKVNPNLWVYNIIGQRGVGGVHPVKYDALYKALTNLAGPLSIYNSNPDKIPYVVVGPRLGAGLAGGHWSIIEAIINETLISENIPVSIYDLPS